jgi:glutamyl-tRNA synthetase
MGVTHILRGDDHVSNTPFQLLLYGALEFPAPKLGHMPMILGEDKKRLSKRHGATSVEEFRQLGILPAALCNYIALLGWSIGSSGDEVLTMEQLIKRFSLKKVNSSPSAFDYEKLKFINAGHIKRLPPAERLALAEPLLQQQGWEVDAAWRLPTGDDTVAYLDRLLKMLGNRFSNLQRLPEQLAFFFTEDFPVDEQAAAEYLRDAEVSRRLTILAEALDAGMASSEPATAGRIEEIVRATAEQLGVEPRELIHPCRVAVTGQTRSAGIFEVMELVGAPRVRARLRRAATTQS